MRFALLLLAVVSWSVPAPHTRVQVVEQAKDATARDFTLSFDHGLGAEEAKRRITRRFKTLQDTFRGQGTRSALTWNEDSAAVWVKALGQTANAFIFVTDANVQIKVHLPLLLAPFSEKVRAVVTKAARDELSS